MAETPEDATACTSRDCQFVHDHSQPATPEGVHRAALDRLDEARRRLDAALIASAHLLTTPFTNAPETNPWERSIKPAMYALRRAVAAVRADGDAAYAAGREAAAQAIRDHADKHAPERASAMRRHLHVAARVAAGPMTDAQMVEAIRRGDFAVCRLDESGRPIGGDAPTSEDVYLNGCPVEVWDGPYLMRCAMGKTRCAHHGPFEPAKRCSVEPDCRRPAGHGGRCNPPMLTQAIADAQDAAEIARGERREV